MALKKINETHKQAMLLKMQGFTHREISGQINRTFGTIETWFCRDPFFRQEYEKFKNEYLQGVIGAAQERLQGAADQAMETLLELTRDESPRIRLDAARDILDRAGFKPGQVLELTGKSGKELEINVNLGGDSDEV